MNKMQKNTRLNNLLYQEYSDDYENFVSHYEVTPILNLLKKRITFDDRSVLEFGAGTGLFTLPLSLLARHIAALELYPSQISILKDKIITKKINNVDIYQRDAMSKLDFHEKQKFDIAFFGFSLDNICEQDVYELLDIRKLSKVIDNAKLALTEGGVFIIVGSMPEAIVNEDRRKVYLQCREAQFEVFRREKQCSIDQVSFDIKFDSIEEARNALHIIVGEQRALEIFSRLPILELQAYVAIFTR
jgi:SAM-dependent methyltransferase